MAQVWEKSYPSGVHWDYCRRRCRSTAYWKRRRPPGRIGQLSIFTIAHSVCKPFAVFAARLCSSR